MSIQLQVYRSRAERWNVTTNYLSRLLCSTQYWGVGIFPKEFYWSAYTIKFPSPNFYCWRWLLMQLLPPATSLSENTFPSTKYKRKWSEPRETAVFHIQKKEGKGRREKGEVFKFRYLLTETQKKHTYRHHVGRNPSSQGCGALLPASVCLKLRKSFLPLSHAHRSVLKIALNCQPKCMSGLMKV